jgi:threonine aldolase
MNFGSDNMAGFSPEMLEALARVNGGRAVSYGDDAVTARVKDRMAEIFEAELEVFPGAGLDGAGLGRGLVPSGKPREHRRMRRP